VLVAGICLIAGAGAVSVRPVAHLLSTAWRDVNQIPAVPAGMADDVSRLNRTPVAEIITVESEQEAAERQLAALLARARSEGLKVSIAGARHSMGGHTIYPGGLVVDMLPFNHMQYDSDRQLLKVQAGARWKEIIPLLDEQRQSVGVMQSDNDFSVGGSLSVNCHGWQFGKPPIASSVESFRLMQADGSIVRCSRDDNHELFSLALGGYGLFGIILDAELHVVPNERYRLEQFVVPVDEALATFEKRVRQDPDAVMVYARMGIVPSDFLEEVILNVFYRDPAADGTLPDLSKPGLTAVRRSLFRGSAGSEYGKGLRWAAEARLQPHLSQKHFSRNQLLNESAEMYLNRSSETTDVLHEYFIPMPNIEAFVVDLRRIIPQYRCDLLNITVRGIETDTDSYLRYADQPVIAFVMFFNQALTAEGEACMQSLTRDLIEAALHHGGRYYLPYRLHATSAQFRRAYRNGDEFFARKRHYDPDELFQNQFYVKYKDSQDPAGASP
jgi:FAD/FMN-containing dehydrogenase